MTRNRPLASLTSVILSCVAGSIPTNLLLGLPVAAAFKSETYLLMIIAAWAGVFYSPQVWVDVYLLAELPLILQDFVFKLVKARPVHCVLWCFKEVDR